MSRPPLPGGLPASPAKNPAQGFVDATARMSLIMGGLMLVYCVGQLAVVLLLEHLDFGPWLQRIGLPPSTGLRWLLDHAVALSWAMLLLTLVFMVVCWGLLRYREWGRQGFIAALVVVGVFNFASLPLVDCLFSGLLALLPEDLAGTAEGRDLLAQMQFSRWACLLTAAATSVAFAALHAWLVVRLRRAEVRQLFGA